LGRLLGAAANDRARLLDGGAGSSMSSGFTQVCCASSLCGCSPRPRTWEHDGLEREVQLLESSQQLEPAHARHVGR
jgi:hypothetical protein